MAASIAGQVAVVTGASSGIGRSTALALARRGVRLALVARSEDRLRETAAAVREQYRGANTRDSEPLVVPADVADREAVEAMADRVLSTFGAIDILVNNAGIAHWAPFAELDAELARRVMEVNVLGAMDCTRAFLPSMLERGSGTIVFVSSGLGAMPFPGASVYCASKHALNGFADSLRPEVEPLGVRVLLAMPGVTKTELSEDLPPRTMQRYLFQPMATADAVGEKIARAIERGRRRELFRLFNDVGLRFAAAFPGFRDWYLRMAGRLIRREYGWGSGARPPVASGRGHRISDSAGAS